MAIISNSYNFNKKRCFPMAQTIRVPPGPSCDYCDPIVPRSGESGSEESPGAKAVRGLKGGFWLLPGGDFAG